MHIEFLELFLLAPAQEASAGKCESASAEHEDADENARSTIVCVEPLLLTATASSSASLNASTFRWWEANSGRSRLVLTRTRDPLIKL